ncbi:hypothetical protein TNCT_385251 [Trichonephila clavata]|uniref:Uncharacterized protein n=1 Tax=Trichonephila clavata TaxID=2740835 RepID=A0A8X6LCR1_TRICU|nr:hypothetical protein TNCT_385251 [Trichonephila clavata]
MIHREERKMLEFRRGGPPLLLLGEGEIVHHAICITPSLHFRRWGWKRRRTRTSCHQQRIGSPLLEMPSSQDGDHH